MAATQSDQQHNAASISTTALAADLASCTISPGNASQIGQIQHRLQLLSTWLGGHQEAKAMLTGKTIVEIGCGQGDMTAALAYMVSASPAPGADSPGKGKVIAIDPAPLDYGGPHTLGQAQGALSKSKLGPYIQWEQRDPVEFLVEQGHALKVDFIVSAHSLFYLPSAEYFSTLLRSSAASASPETRLLLAEWGMKTSVPEAEAHLLAVRVQMKCPVPHSNVRTVLEPETIQSMAQEAGWILKSQGFIQSPDLHDGRWEVGNAQRWTAPKTTNHETKEKLLEMENAVQRYDGVVKCMDVWTGVWAVR